MLPDAWQPTDVAQEALIIGNTSELNDIAFGEQTTASLAGSLLLQDETKTNKLMSVVKQTDTFRLFIIGNVDRENNNCKSMWFIKG